MCEISREIGKLVKRHSRDLVSAVFQGIFASLILYIHIYIYTYISIFLKMTAKLSHITDFKLEFKHKLGLNKELFENAPLT